MKRFIFNIIAAVTAPCLCAGTVTRHVDTMIGTGAIDGGLCGNNYPGATIPFGMVQLSPDTHPAPDWFSASGYNYNDHTIYGFSHSRLSGTGVCDLLDVTLFPTVTDRTTSAFSHDREQGRPGLYTVRLDDERIDVALTATPRTGVHRYTYPKGASAAKVWVDLDHSMQKGSWGCHIINSRITAATDSTLEGYRVITGWAKLRRVYFSMVFSRPFERLQFYSSGKEMPAGTTTASGDNLKALCTFADPEEPVVCRVGLSSASASGARANLRAEAPTADFDLYAHRADSLWQQTLGAIEIEAPDSLKTTFYTALYHAMIQPNLFSDTDGAFMQPDYSTGYAPEGENQYTTFSLWDTFRATHPLYTLLQPERDAEMVNSMIRYAENEGILPLWELYGQDNYCMIGNHAIPVVVDAVLKELPGIDAQRAWKAVRATATQPHINSPWDVWEKYGYMPEDLQTQSVSITLENAYDDWCVAQLAGHLGLQEDSVKFARRSQFYRNVFDPSTGFFRGKNSKGEWLEPFSPLAHGANGGSPFTEGNAWQYYWYVPHNMPDLVSLTGGPKAFERKLDEFFTTEESLEYHNQNVSGCIGQYAHGNEPSHHVAYLYNEAGAPRKTQQMVRRIVDEMYNNTASGYAGNDDCGQMSAWYVFSALGFYPVNPASGEYALGTPRFDSATIHLPNGRDFTVKARRKGPEQWAVKSVRLNGKPYKSLNISHEDILKGGELEFVM